MGVGLDRCRWWPRCCWRGVLSDRFERRRLLDRRRRPARRGDRRDRGCSRSPTRPSCGTWSCWWSLYGVGEALFQPAFTAIVPDVVPQEELLQANALKELMEPIGLRFAGPALGGLLIAVFGVGTALRGRRGHVRRLGRRGRADVAPAAARATERGSVRRDLRRGLRLRARARLAVGDARRRGRCSCSSPTARSRCWCPYLIRNELGGDAATFGAVMSAGGLGLDRRGAAREPHRRRRAAT